MTRMTSPAQPRFRKVVDSNGRVYRIGETDRDILGRSRAWMVWLPWAGMMRSVSSSTATAPPRSPYGRRTAGAGPRRSGCFPCHAGYEDHVDVQRGVGGDKVAAICMFIGPGSLYVLGLWPTSRSTSSTCGPTADSCLTVSRDHRRVPTSVDQRI